MKKLHITITLILITLSVQTTMAQQQVEKTETTVKAKTINQNTYQDIDLDEVSDIVATATKKKYPKAKIEKAYVDTIGNYKLILATKKGSKTVYANQEGEWFNPKKKG